MSQPEEKRSVSIFINGNQADQTLKTITATSKKLNAELGQLVPGTDAFKKKVEELKSVNAQLQAVRDDVKGVSGAFGFLKTEIGKLGVLATGVLGFQFLTDQIHNVISSNAKLSDSLADVQKSTGMSEMAVKRLSASFKEIDTRSSKKELLDLAFVAGKLGISGEKDVLGFVRAADQIGVTLGKAFANTEEAINDVGKIVNLFKIKDEFGLEKALLKTGSAINDLGNAGTANEGYIIEFTKRLGGIAPQANMSVQSVLGLATVFDELGQPVEASATAVGKLMIMLGQNLPKYAHVAQMSVKDFSDLLAKDGNAALIAVLKHVQATNGGIADLAAHMGMIGEDASRSITAIGALANNLDLLKDRQDLSNKSFEKGTSLTDQFNIKNNNFGAQLDKLGKKLAAIGQNPGFTDFLIKATKLTGDFIDFISHNLKTIGAFFNLIVAGAVAYGTYNAVLLVSNLAQKAWLATLMESEAITRLVILAETAWSVVTLTLTGRLKEAKQAMILFDAAMDANPIGIVLAAVAALVTALVMFNDEVTDAMKIQKALNSVSAEAQKNLEDETYKLKELNKIRNDETASHERKITAVEKMRQLYPDILKGLTDEEALTKKGTKAIDEYVMALEKKFRAEAAEEKIKELQKRNIDLKYAKDNTTGWDNTKAFLSSMGPGGITGIGRAYNAKKGVYNNKNNQEEIALNNATIKQIEDEYGKDMTNNALGVKAGPSDVKAKRTVQVIEAEIAALKEEQKNVSATSAEWKKYEQQIKKLQDEEEAITGKSKKGTNERERALEAFMALAEKYKVFQAKELEDLMAKNDKEIAATKAKYEALIYEEKQFLTKKGSTPEQRRATNLAIASLEAQESAQVIALKIKQEQELTDKVLKLRDELNNRTLSLYDQEKVKINEFYNQQIKDAGTNTEEVGKLEIDRTKDLADAKLREKKRFQAEKKSIEEQAMFIHNKTDDLQMARINRRYDDEITALKAKFSKEFQLTKQFQDAVAAINKNRDEEISLEKYKKVKDIAINTTQDISNAVFTIERNNENAAAAAQIADLEKQKEAELSNQNLTQAQKASITKDYQDKERQIKIQQWEADKTAAEEQAVINGALAVVKALPNPIAAVAAGVAAAAQLAIIMAQPTPAFEHGGYSAVNYSAPQGFVNRPTLFANSTSGRAFTAGEGHKTEYIISSEQLKDPVVADFAKTLESNRGVRRFEAGGYSNAVKVVKTSSGVSNISSTGSFHETNQLLREMAGHFQDFAQKPWDFNMRAFTIYQDKLNTIQTAANAK